MHYICNSFEPIKVLLGIIVLRWRYYLDILMDILYDWCNALFKASINVHCKIWKTGQCSFVWCRDLFKAKLERQYGIMVLNASSLYIQAIYPKYQILIGPYFKREFVIYLGATIVSNIWITGQLWCGQPGILLQWLREATTTALQLIQFSLFGIMAAER